MFKYENLTPFQLFCCNNFPFIEETFDSLTTYKMLCKIVGYLQDEIIPNVDNIGNSQNEVIGKFNELKSFVDNYFNNLDVQDEINKKLDTMATDGTLENIINQEIFGEIKNELDNLSTKSQETLISLSFHSEDNIITNFINFSNDGVNWKQIKLNNFYGRDPSFVFDKKRKCFYITVTPYSNQEYSFSIFKTYDFKTFIEKKLSIGNYYGEDIMGPDLFYDENNDNLIVNFSYKTGNKVNDVDNNEINEYNLYRTIIGNLDNFNELSIIEPPTKLILNGATNSCIIDSNIIYHNNLFYLNCKDDIQKIIQVYQSADGINYNLICNNILNNSNFNDNTIYLEGGSFFKFNDCFYILADSYYNLHTNIIGKTSDFINYEFSKTNLNLLRHSSVISSNDDNIKKILFDLQNFGYSSNDTLTFYPKTNNPSKLINDNFEGEITAIPGMLYTFLGNAHITNILNPFHCEKIDFMFATATNKIITIDKIENIDVNKKFINSLSFNSKLFNIFLNASTNAYPSNDFENLTEFNKDFINSYFEFTNGISLADGKAFRSGNIMCLFMDLHFSQTVNGYLSFATQKESVEVGILKPKSKILMNSDTSLIGNVAMFENANINANFNNVPSNSNHTIYAVYCCV